MKKNNLKVVTMVLIVILICLVSFVGIYVQKGNKMQNIVKDYSLSKDLKGYRQIMFKVSNAKKVVDKDGKYIGDTDSYDDDSIKSNKYKKTDDVNPKENLTEENYELTKSVIEKRLNKFKIADYNLSLDKSSGTVYLQVPEDYMTNIIVSNIKETGALELKDSTNGKVFLTEKNLQSAAAVYNTEQSGTVVYLRLQFDQEGTNILKDLSSNEYATKEQSSEQSSDESKDDKKDEKEEETQKEVVLTISGSDMVTSSFGDVIEDGTMMISMGNASSDTNTINNTMESASRIAVLLNNGAIPLKYNVSQNQYVATDLSAEFIKKVIIGVIVIIMFALLYMIVKYKLRGLLAAISCIGFIGLYLLVIKYTNVVLSLEGIVGIILAIGLNYLFNMKFLKLDMENKNEYKKEFLSSIMKALPVLVISFIFGLLHVVHLSSIGMVMFYGIILVFIYNILITKNILDE